jgi:hypothetical protein
MNPRRHKGLPPGHAKLARFGRWRSARAVAILAVGATVAGCTAPMSDAPTSAGGADAAPVSANGYVRLERGAHPLARPEFDLGPLDPNRRLTNLLVVFKLSPEQERDRDALRAAHLDPGSPSYHQWLTPEAYAARFGAKDADIARTQAWLARQGLDVQATSRLGARVNFAGRVADLQTAFRTEIHGYKVGAETHYAMATAPSIPSELADVVLALHNTHDFYPAPAVKVPTAVPQAFCSV